MAAAQACLYWWIVSGFVLRLQGIGHAESRSSRKHGGSDHHGSAVHEIPARDLPIHP
jgi:hypothetical protein